MKTLIDPKNILADDIIQLNDYINDKFCWHLKCGYNLFTNLVFSVDYKRLEWITCYLCNHQFYINADLTSYNFYLHKSIII